MNIQAKITDWLKRMSAYMQAAPSSFKRHNAQYGRPSKLEIERSIAQQYERDNVFNNEEYKLRDFLDQHTDVREIAVDIGSGAGWLSSKLSKEFKRVIAIEPSLKAIQIAQTLYPKTQYPNIEWRQGFAENVLPRLRFSTPAFFLTGVVLSHLRDKEVTAICAEVNRLALKGSLLCFNECWGEEWHQNMWHVRTKEWWQQQLPDWELDFHGPQIQNIPGRHKGFHGMKAK